MQTIVDFLQTWGVILALTGAQIVLPLSVGMAFHLVLAWLDRKHPDNLPLTAGQWVREQIDTHSGLHGVRVVVSPSKQKGIDAFWPAPDIILLRQQTFFKNDPSFWAIGAHEVGHVVVHRKHALLRGLLNASRTGTNTLAGLGTACVLANVLYGAPAINRVALWLVASSVALNGVVLADELAASWVGMRLLRKDGRLGGPQRAVAATALGCAWMTYFAALAGRVLMLVEWSVIAALVERRQFSPAAATSAGATVVVLSVLVGLMILAGIRRFVVSGRSQDAGKAAMGAVAGWIEALVRGLAVVVLLWIVWDQPGGLVFQFCCVAAALAARRIWGTGLAIVLVPAMLVGAVVFMLLIAVVVVFGAKYYTGRIKDAGDKLADMTRGEDSEAVRAAEQAGKPDVEEAGRILEEAKTQTSVRQPWQVRLEPLLEACAAAPLLYVLWIG